MESRFIQREVAISAILLALAVVAGAFGAHGLRGVITERYEEVWKTAVFYHLFHGLGILVLSLLLGQKILSVKSFRVGTFFMKLGIFLFSGSLYLLVLSSLISPDYRWLGAVTPFGGLSFILGWIVVFLGAFSISKSIQS